MLPSLSLTIFKAQLEEVGFENSFGQRSEKR
jgi:hypothetical protein